MSFHLNPRNVTLKEIFRIIDRYDDHVPGSLNALDKERYETVPHALKKRTAKGHAYLTKSELESLVQWKIKHGKFRPALPKLVASNSAEVIQETTSKAFKLYSADPTTAERAVKVLNELKGIGPATSSLLLSLYDPSSAPFFSDEFFRYVLWNSAGSPGGWDRKLKYDMKELTLFYGEVRQLLRRLRQDSDKIVDCVEVEKAAFVLGKEKLDLSTEIVTDSPESEPTIRTKRKRSEKSIEKEPKKRDRKYHSQLPPGP